MQVTRTVTDWYSGFQRFVQTRAEFAPLKAIFALPPEKMADFNFCHQFHFNAIGIVRGQLNQPLEDMLAAAFAGYVADGLSVPGLGGDPADASALQENGFTTLPPATAEQIDGIRTHLDRQKVFSGSMENSTNLQPLEEVRAEGHNLAHFTTESVLTCPHVMDLALDRRALGPVENHLRVTPTLIGLTAWWSFGAAAEARDAQLFHFDLDDYRFAKQFIYLTDVDEESGPHCYAEASHRTDRVIAARDSWPDGADAFMAWYLRLLRKSDADVARAFENRIHRLTGPAGSRFLVDTGGIHKGERPTARDRLIVQMEYAATPMLTELFEPRPLPEIAAVNPGAASWQGAPFDYTRRLFLS